MHTTVIRTQMHRQVPRAHPHALSARAFSVSPAPASVPSVEIPAGSCPITGMQSQKAPRPGKKAFADIPGPPRYPLLGSIRDFQSHKSTIMIDVMRDYYYEYGPIVRQNLNGDEVIIYDPREYLKVFRSEGKYPNGGAAEFWPMTRYYELAGKFPGLLMTGAPWKELRNKLQHDIVSPQAATSYLPKLNPIAKSASKIFPTGAADLDDFTTRTAFDMFAEAVLGKNRGILFPETADPRDREFAENSKKALSLAGNLIYSPKENMLKKLVRTPLWNEFSAAMDITMKRALEISREVADSIDKVEKNPSTSTEEVKTAAQEMAQAENLWDGVGVSDVSETDGYIRRLIKSGKLTAEEAALEVSNLLFAGVETTSNSMNWLIWSLANNPEKQDKLAHELKTVLKGGDYNRDEKLPYLRAFYREVHRMTPVTSGVTNRKLEAPIELMQYEIPAGVKITLNSNAIQNDPRIVEDNEKFLPERWLADQVEKRKGTHLEVLDHKLLATPFSFGPRMCLGGRLAEAELLSLLARLVQDWEISVAPDCPPINRAEKLFLKLSDSPKLLVKPRV